MSDNKYLNQENAPYIAAIVLIILAFSSIWMTWINIKVKVYGSSYEETVDFTDILETDEEYTGYSNKLDDYSSGMSEVISESKYDDILNSYHAMKYAGIAGYILLLLTAVCTFINKKAMTVASILSTLAFAVSTTGGILYCSKTKSFMEDFTKEFIGGTIPIDYEFHINIGIIIPLAASLIITIIGFKIKNNDEISEYY